MSEDIVTMAKAAMRDERLSDGALYGKLAAEIERLRAALAEVASCVQLLGLDGWSDAPHVMNVITRALKDRP